MICDILAKERGPSFKKMGQIPQLRVFKYHEVKDFSLTSASPRN